MDTQIFRLDNYISDKIILINNIIREYDISKANISILRQYNVIDDSLYNKLYKSDKLYRNIYIGNLCKDESISNILSNGFIESRKILFTRNNINKNDILSIKKDAIYTIDKELKYTTFGYINFNCKNTYTIFMKLCNLEIYYMDNIIDNKVNINIDVKGINDNLLPLHQNGILGFICDVCYKLLRNPIQDIVKYISNFYDDYVNRRLDICYYRDLDMYSLYTINTKYTSFKLKNISYDMINIIDINRNLQILRDLLYIISSKMNMNIRF